MSKINSYAAYTTSVMVWGKGTWNLISSLKLQQKNMIKSQEILGERFIFQQNHHPQTYSYMGSKKPHCPEDAMVSRFQFTAIFLAGL